MSFTVFVFVPTGVRRRSIPRATWNEKDESSDKGTAVNLPIGSGKYILSKNGGWVLIDIDFGYCKVFILLCYDFKIRLLCLASQFSMRQELEKTSDDKMKESFLKEIDIFR